MSCRSMYGSIPVPAFHMPGILRHLGRTIKPSRRPNASTLYRTHEAPPSAHLGGTVQLSPCNKRAICGRGSPPSSLLRRAAALCHPLWRTKGARRALAPTTLRLHLLSVDNDDGNLGACSYSHLLPVPEGIYRITSQRETAFTR